MAFTEQSWKELAMYREALKLGYCSMKPQQLDVLRTFLKERMCSSLCQHEVENPFAYQALPFIFDDLFGHTTSFVLVLSINE